MIDHGIRDHATWAASETARNFLCKGALAMKSISPPDQENIHSATGTAAHQIAEKCLRHGTDAIDYLGDVEKTKKFEIKIDEEICTNVQTYVDLVRKLAKESEGVVLMIEQRFSLAELRPPFDAGGTGDAVLYFPVEKLLQIVDYKNGTGIVNVKENPQLRSYALGALLANPGFDVEKVRSTIVQPRAFHRDGPVRSETLPVTDLIDWTHDLVQSMKLSAQAIEEFETCNGNRVLLDDWYEKWLKPGACKFCPAEGFCPALRKAAIDKHQGVANVWFNDFDEPEIRNQPEVMSPAELAKTLDHLDLLEDWIKAVRGYAHKLADGGTEIPGYFLADKIGRRKWAAERDKVVADLRAKGLTDEQIFEEPDVRSPAQIEKVLGAKKKGLIENMFHSPVTGKNLVAAAKSTRPPTQSTVDKYFEQGA